MRTQKMSLVCQQKTDRIEWRPSRVANVPVVLGNVAEGPSTVTLSVCLIT